MSKNQSHSNILIFKLAQRETDGDGWEAQNFAIYLCSILVYGCNRSIWYMYLYMYMHVYIFIQIGLSTSKVTYRYMYVYTFYINTSAFCKNRRVAWWGRFQHVAMRRMMLFFYAPWCGPATGWSWRRKWSTGHGPTNFDEDKLVWFITLIMRITSKSCHIAHYSDSWCLMVAKYRNCDWWR